MKHRFQFSLKTLFVGVTLLAASIWVALDRQRLIHERNQARQRATIAEGSLGAVKNAIQAKPLDDSARLQFADWLIGNAERRLQADQHNDR